MPMPTPPAQTRKYATVESELQYFIDAVLKNPAKNFGLDLVVDPDIKMVRFAPENLRQMPCVLLKQTSIVPTRWGKVEKIDPATGTGFTGATYNLNFEIHAIIQHHQAIVYNGVKYTGVEPIGGGLGTLDVLKSILMWTLLANWQSCDSTRNWNWRNLTVMSADFTRGYNNDKNIDGVRIRCSLDWEWDVPNSSIKV